MFKISKSDNSDSETKVDRSVALAVAALGCVGFAFYGYEHNYSGAGWLVVIAVLLFLELIG
jgi:hypothetical protein